MDEVTHYRRRTLHLVKFCIISDNAKVLQDAKFSSYNESPHPYLINLIINLLITTKSSAASLIKWLPGHSEHPYLTFVDSLAKTSSSSSDASQVNIVYSNYEAGTITDAWIWGKWLNEWKANPKGTYQNTFTPNKYFIIPNKSRKKDIILNRMRLLQTKLNSGLHRIGLHQDGLCESCGVEESCQHFILHCPRTAELRKAISRGITSALPCDYQELLSNLSATEIIVNYVIAQNISI